ncbi:hypothetical protein [Neobacillus muris]|uniref:hypothetical protein n=1 Tax=Neobacillus muris TaxID=2941334 RepID=UPI00203FB835|nr:hypothetical protein [Neobacillus muris]
MDKTVIMDVFDFVGFHLCKALLDKGVEVEGVYIEEHQPDLYIDKKRLEVGRNANFIDIAYSVWNKKARQNSLDATLILSLYDVFMTRKESILSGLDFKTILDNWQSNDNQIVFLAPVQLLAVPSLNKDIAYFLNQAEEQVKNLQIFYLPTIYGPWQPVDFLFQQVIISGRGSHPIQPYDREWTGDAIYAADAVETIVDLIEDGKSGNYLLESTEENTWEECARLLSIENQLLSPAIGDLPQSVTKVPVRNLLSITESLSRQKEHTNRVLEINAKDH